MVTEHDPLYPKCGTDCPTCNPISASDQRELDMIADLREVLDRHAPSDPEIEIVTTHSQTWREIRDYLDEHHRTDPFSKPQAAGPPPLSPLPPPDLREQDSGRGETPIESAERVAARILRQADRRAARSPSDGLIEVPPRPSTDAEFAALPVLDLPAMLAEVERMRAAGPFPVRIDVAPDVWAALKRRADTEPVSESFRPLAALAGGSAVPTYLDGALPAGGWRARMSDGSTRANFEEPSPAGPSAMHRAAERACGLGMDRGSEPC